MNKVKTCPVCGAGKKKRSCKLQMDDLICESCCNEKQSYDCNGCSFYQDKILRFKCESCGKTSIDDQPSEITHLMGAKIFRLEMLEGKIHDNGHLVSGEIYTTMLQFPFEGKLNTPVWFYYDPDDRYHTLQLIEGEILDVKEYNHYDAKIEIFVHQTATCETIKNIFPEQQLPESLYDIESLFPVGTLKAGISGNFIRVSSLTQDGGNWAVIFDDDIDPRIILYSEGWFSHWQEYVGNIRIKKHFLQQIQDHISKISNNK